MDKFVQLMVCYICNILFFSKLLNILYQDSKPGEWLNCSPGFKHLKVFGL